MLLDSPATAALVCYHPPTKRVKGSFGIGLGLSNTTVVPVLFFVLFLRISFIS